MSHSREEAWDNDLRRMLDEHRRQEVPSNEPAEEPADQPIRAGELILSAFAHEPHRTSGEWQQLYNEASEPDAKVRLN